MELSGVCNIFTVYDLSSRSCSFHERSSRASQTLASLQSRMTV
jgi:hypothetical protein